jgi:hypothetical protein
MEFSVQLPRRPASIAKRDEPARRALWRAKHAEDVYRRGQRPFVGDLNAPLTRPVERVEDETALRFDRAARMNRHIRPAIGLDLKLLEQRVQSQPRHDPPDPDAQRAILVMLTHGDHRAFEARIADARHGEQQLAREVWRIAGHVRVRIIGKIVRPEPSRLIVVNESRPGDL